MLPTAAEHYEELRELVRAKFPEYDLEIRDGQPVVMSPHDAVSSFLVIRLGRHLDAWAQGTGAWWVFDSNAGFRFDDGDLVAPDVSVISRARLPDLPRGWATGVPEVAFEVRSSRDRLPALRRRGRGRSRRSGARRVASGHVGGAAPGADRVTGVTRIRSCDRRALAVRAARGGGDGRAKRLG